MTKCTVKKDLKIARELSIKLIVAGCLVGAVVVFTMVVKFQETDPEIGQVGAGHISASAAQRFDIDSLPESNTKTVANIWRKDIFEGQYKERPLNDSVMLFDRSLESVVDPDYLYAVLQDVELDQYGDVVLDHKALQALELTVNRGRLKLNALELAELQELIQIGLPGKAGEQTARIIGDYYNYLGAREEMGELQLSLEKPTFNTWRKEFQELVKLREMYLGEEVSSSLFTQSDANAEYMFTVMALDHSEEYSEEEKQLRRDKAAETLLGDLVNIDDWSDRYQHYKNEKQTLENSLGETINAEDKDLLLSRHFTLAEIQQLIHRNLDRMM